MGPYDPEWTIYVLRDLQNFFAENNMPIAARKSLELQQIVRDGADGSVAQLEDWRVGRST